MTKQKGAFCRGMFNICAHLSKYPDVYISQMEILKIANGTNIPKLEKLDLITRDFYNQYPYHLIKFKMTKGQIKEFLFGDYINRMYEMEHEEKLAMLRKQAKDYASTYDRDKQIDMKPNIASENSVSYKILSDYLKARQKLIEHFKVKLKEDKIIVDGVKI